MTSVADRVVSVLVRELLAAGADGVRVMAVTTVSSLVAGGAANRLGAELALATGFGTLDAPAEPTLTLGDARLGTPSSAVGPLSDTFVAVARGLVGVLTSPAQLDARGATNLSRIGGSNEAPKVALPGSRGLPENNDSPSRVWYVFSRHSPRTLVERVDFESGPPPSPGRIRRLVTPLGVFALGEGWRAEALFPGVEERQVRENTGFGIDCSGAGIVDDPTPEEAAALEAVDPHRMREIEFLPGEEAAARIAEITMMERT